MTLTTFYLGTRAAVTLLQAVVRGRRVRKAAATAASLSTAPSAVAFTWTSVPPPSARGSALGVPVGLTTGYLRVCRCITRVQAAVRGRQTRAMLERLRSPPFDGSIAVDVGVIQPWAHTSTGHAAGAASVIGHSTRDAAGGGGASGAVHVPLGGAEGLAHVGMGTAGMEEGPEVEEDSNARLPLSLPLGRVSAPVLGLATPYLNLQRLVVALQAVVRGVLARARVRRYRLHKGGPTRLGVRNASSLRTGKGTLTLAAPVSLSAAFLRIRACVTLVQAAVRGRAARAAFPDATGGE